MLTATSPANPRITYRFLALLSTGLLALCAGYAAIVLHSAPWAEASQLDAIFPFYKWRTRLFSPAEYATAKQLMLAGAALMAALFGALALGQSGRAELTAWGRELRAAPRFWAPWASLTQSQRRWAGGALAALTLLRLMLSSPAVNAEYDDAASYTLFVSKGLIAVSSYYPIPNNHVFSNTLSWLFYQLHSDFWWTMRLPVVLAATATTALMFVGLLRHQVRFWPAIMAVGLFSLAQLSVYHAAVGRGYWLLTGLAMVVFFCTLALQAGNAVPRLAWTGLVVAGVLGTYTVPTFAMVLGSAFTWLGLHWWQHFGRLGRLAAAGAAVVAGTLLLYTPLLFISGPAMLFSNGFVASHPIAEFLKGLPLYLWQTEGFLAGQMKVGGLLTLATLAAVAYLWRRGRAGQLPPALATPWQRLVPVTLWFMLFPYAMVVSQRVFPPGRTLLYKAFFLFVLVALVVEWLLQTRAMHGKRWLRPALGLAFLLWCTYQFTSLWRDNRRPSQNNAQFHAAFAWLATQPIGPVLVPEPTHYIFLGMYFLSERAGQPWKLDGRPLPGKAYSYVVAFPNLRGYFQPVFTQLPAYRNPEVDIYRVPTPAPLADANGLPPYYHLAD
ncbi:hypothetical protein [Hymenobacter arizonensis]|uniref:Glycosyltransferase RgtA/B/C/D-like domain-containing protein n=1 Tax=Hymenobacter arizonensis TaxID=1227077 RepID=A0A1I5U047_HYMAR|nr:hypothetical protein [Hymenobacter arizonensis]SFP88663.1 hypothetical protein SAMN04515668_0692 [Hymenobacter arizonensis]